MRQTVVKWGSTVMFVLTLAGGASAAVESLEEAVEAVALELRLNPDLTGTVGGRSCESCELKEFAVNASTRAFAGKTQVDLRKALKHNGMPATIVYDVHSGKATKIIW